MIFMKLFRTRIAGSAEARLSHLVSHLQKIVPFGTADGHAALDAPFFILNIP